MQQAAQGLLLQEELPKKIQKEFKMKEFFIVSKKLERNDTKRAQRKTGSQRFSVRGKKFIIGQKQIIYSVTEHRLQKSSICIMRLSGSIGSIKK